MGKKYELAKKMVAELEAGIDGITSGTADFCKRLGGGNPCDHCYAAGDAMCPILSNKQASLDFFRAKIADYEARHAKKQEPSQCATCKRDTVCADFEPRQGA